MAERIVNFKSLRLVNPLYAQTLGIPAEGPVFVSPIQSVRETCKPCGVIYSPLIYSVGPIIKSQHFHPSMGGIYYFSAPEDIYEAIIKDEQSRFKWVCEIEPCGEKFLWKKEVRLGEKIVSQYRAEGVKVNKIRAFCTKQNSTPEELLEGSLVARFNFLQDLQPLCNTDKHNDLTRYYQNFGSFEIYGQGRISFSNP